MATDDKSTIPEFGDKLKAALDLTTILKDMTAGVGQLQGLSVELNKTFGQGLERVSEMTKSFKDSIPLVTRLGGSIGDVSKTMNDIALASRRNVIANSEDVTKLYEASKILGTDARTLSDTFLNIGTGIEQIGSQVEKSIQYVNSIGGNAAQVMKTVTDNMSVMNRFQFEGGVQGLTKMAAQATMLRFNMNETFQLADKVLDPEKAIEVASAFQRLGVAAGSLVDPFQLMNQSINDPSGLQNSLKDVAKQFTYFDDKTKTFKINPQGVLTLKAMQEQTGVSAAEMSKLGLAAADVERRVQSIRPDIKFKNEEDKEYLMNIAKMREDGKYEVTLDDGTKKELGELTQPQLDKLLQEQKNAPKTMEDIQRSQLKTSELLLADLHSIRDKVVYGVAGAKGPTQIAKQIRKGEDAFLGSASKGFSQYDLTKRADQLFDSISTLTTDLFKGKKGIGSSFEDFNKKMGELGKDMTQDMKKGLFETLKTGKGKLDTNDNFQKSLSDWLESHIGDANKIVAESSKATPITNKVFINGNPSSPNTMASQNDASQNQSNTTTKVEFSDLRIVPPPGTTLTQQQLDATFNSPQFKQYIAKLSEGEKFNKNNTANYSS